MDDKNESKWLKVVQIIATAIVSVLSTLFATSCCGVSNPFS